MSEDQQLIPSNRPALPMAANVARPERRLRRTNGVVQNQILCRIRIL
jgi:hypothetical protein